MARSRNEEPEMEDGDVPDHPALKNHSRFGTQAKHVVGGAFKGALIGGAVGGAAFGLGAAALGAGAIVAGGPFTMIPAAVMVLFGIGTSFVGSAVTGAAITGLINGAAIGAAGGGLMAVSSASDAADVEEDKIVNKYEQAMARKQSMDRLREVRDRQAEALARMDGRSRNPNRGLPAGREQDGMAVS